MAGASRASRCSIIIRNNGKRSHLTKPPRGGGFLCAFCAYGPQKNALGTFVALAMVIALMVKHTSSLLFEQLQSLAAEITKAIRTASVNRNKALAHAVSALETASKSAEEILKEEHISPQHKGVASTKVAEARNMLAVPMADELSEGIRQEALDQLDILTGKVKGASTYRALNLIPGLKKLNVRL